MIFNMVGSGSSSLNFFVVVSIAEPSNPKENMVWVNTETPSPKWTVSATEPTNPVNGEVWIATEDSSNNPIDIAKKNSVFVYPSYCEQYVNGIWEMRDAYIFKNGEFVNFSSEIFYIVKNGEFVRNITFATGHGTVSGNVINSGGNYVAIAYFPNAVNVTNYKKLIITSTYVKSWNYNDVPCIFVANSEPRYASTGNLANLIARTKWRLTSSASTALTEINKTETIELDVSDLTGPVFVGLAVSGTSTFSGTVTIESFFME